MIIIPKSVHVVQFLKLQSPLSYLNNVDRGKFILPKVKFNRAFLEYIFLISLETIISNVRTGNLKKFHKTFLITTPQRD